VTHGVLLVEDDPSTRARLAGAVAAHPDLEVLGEAGTFADGSRLLRRLAPDVLLVDVGLPDGSGIRLIREARLLSADTQSMVITVFADEKCVMEAIEAGARGYLLKDAAPARVADAVLQLIAGGSPISAPIARHLLRRFQDAAEAAPPDAEAAGGPHLSEREREVLALLAKGFRYQEIADLLHVSGHTVTTHIRRIYRKLEVNSRSQAVYEAANLGLLDLGD
jgi:DNA-binding NarL/FixJ family response regulator